MVTIQFALNEENIKRAGYSIAKVEKYLRDFFAERHASEVAYLTFQRDDENAMCDLGDIHDIMIDHPNFMKFFEKCLWDIDGEVENCIEELKDYIAKYGS